MVKRRFLNRKKIVVIIKNFQIIKKEEKIMEREEMREYRIFFL